MATNTQVNFAELFCDEDSEKALLGCILHDGRRLLDARALLTFEDFWLVRHQHVFAAMCRLADDGLALDIVTVAAELKRSRQLADVGGHSYLAQLAGTLVNTAHVESYARVADRAYAAAPMPVIASKWRLSPG